MAKAKTQISKAQALAADVNKFLGTDAVKMASDPSLVVEYLPTGVGPMDYLLNGGIARNRFIELFGGYSVLKSYVGLRAIATTQANGGVCALVDTEHAFDPEWATSLGVDTSALLLPPTATGEQAIDVTEYLIRQDVDLIVWDSVAATLPQTEQKKRLADENVQPARLAQLMSTGLRKLNAANSRSAILCINQTRMNVGITFGNPEVAAGGRSLPYYASMRVNMSIAGRNRVQREAVGPDGKMTKVNHVAGMTIRAKLEKSKLSQPNTEVVFYFDTDSGSVDEIGWQIAQMINDGVILKQGAMYTYGQNKYRGMEQLRKAIEGAPKTTKKKIVRKKR